jgi:hypothetical protein
MPDNQLPHIFIEGFVTSSDFKSPLSVQKEAAPQRPRAAHGERLLGQIQSLAHEAQGLSAQRANLELPGQGGMTVAIEIYPKGAVEPKTFEWKKDGIEVLTVSSGNNVDIVALHVPDGKLSALEKRVQEYMQKDHPKSGKPANANLINAIENVRRAAFSELWTDSAPPHAANEIAWCQIWLRQTARTAQATRDHFEQLASKLNIEVEPGFVSFPGRVVVAVRSSRETLENSFQLLDMVAEIRKVEPTAEFFLADLKPYEQAAWIADLSERTEITDDDQASFITVLDTGINRGHPLLANALSAADMHTVHPTWPADDHHGHGTQMAGLALYGNLVPVMAGGKNVSIPHRLESVKIWPAQGQNAPHLYGSVCTEATARVEVSYPNRKRIFAMMTTSSGTNTGEPSEWSATLDQLAYGRAPLDIGGGAEDVDDVRVQRLFVLSAGNIPWNAWTAYPDINALSPIENPAQAWNALTVGACTDLTDIDAAKYPAYQAIAPAGGLCPASTTSILWSRPWPYKPDVVAEGGNASIEHGLHVSVGPESLRLLTTSRDVLNNPLTESGDTSGAAAEVARLCAHIYSKYPDYWPETVRGLVIHGARYSQKMLATLHFPPRRRDKENLLKTFGYGAVSHSNSVESTNNRPTLVIQRTFFPYRLEKSAVKLGQMQLHALPWPTDELLQLGAADVTMRITLSYFVEPNPSKRGWQSKFRYQSYALRFAVKAATETEEAFMARVNKLERDADSEESYPDPDGGDWTFGAQLRSRGSVHSDIWTGTAAQLATKSQIAVFPVGGWWKDWKEAAQHNTEARYSLIVSLQVAEGVDADIYTPIINKIQVPVVIDISAGT